MVPFLPESPRYLISRGRVVEGTHILGRLYHLEDDDPQILAERDKIIETLASEIETGEATWKELFTQGTQRTFQRLLLGIGPLLMNQWSGIQAIRYEADLQRSD